MVFQSYALFPHMTVLENVAYGPLVSSGRRKAEAQARAEEGLALVGLAGFGTGCRASSRAASSSGSRWRARWCSSRRCCCSTSRSPTSTPSCAGGCARRSATCSASSGSPRSTSPTTRAEALAVSDRIIVMSNAEIAQDGTPRELYEQPPTCFVADFIGDANIDRGRDRRGRRRRGRGQARLGDAPAAAPRARAGPRPAGDPARGAPALGPPGPTAIEGEVLKATYLGSHMEYEVGALGELFVVDRDTEEMLAPGDSRRRRPPRPRRDPDPGRLIPRGCPASPLSRAAGRPRAPPSRRRRPVPPRGSGCPPQPVAREEVVDPAAGLLDEEDAREAVPRVDVQLEVGVGPAVGDVGQPQGARPAAPEVGAGLEHPLDYRHVRGVRHARRPADLDAGALDPIRAGHPGSAPRSAWRRARAGQGTARRSRELKMAPSCTAPPATNATETQNRVTPRTKFAVPSIGSTTHTASPTRPPSSSPRNRSPGHSSAKRRASSRSTAASASLA